MLKIGEKIKELRKAQDVTHELPQFVRTVQKHPMVDKIRF